VTEWGMSRLGPVSLAKKEEHVFLGKEIGTGREYSERTAIDIDDEIKRIISENYNRARSLLKDNIEKLKNLSNALLEKETLDAGQVDSILFEQTAMAMSSDNHHQ
jgi:cell division protease FtsH